MCARLAEFRHKKPCQRQRDADGVCSISSMQRLCNVLSIFFIAIRQIHRDFSHDAPLHQKGMHPHTKAIRPTYNIWERACPTFCSNGKTIDEVLTTTSLRQNTRLTTPAPERALQKSRLSCIFLE